jgi:hypothetical protein
MSNEMQWPNQQRRRELVRREPFFYGGIGFIDGTLVKIHRPSNINEHLSRRYYTRRKKIYGFNNTIAVDHDGLIIYVDPGYGGSYQDITILKQSDLYRNWRDYFTVGEENYFEYLLGDRN